MVDLCSTEKNDVKVILTGEKVALSKMLADNMTQARSFNNRVYFDQIKEEDLIVIAKEYIIEKGYKYEDGIDGNIKNVLMAMESGQEVCSLHQVIYQSEGDEIHLEDKLEQQADLIEQTVDNIYVQELLKKLNEQERQIIHMRYFQNQTQAAIAKKIGISQVQVSRMEKKILNKLRKNANTKEN